MSASIMRQILVLYPLLLAVLSAQSSPAFGQDQAAKSPFDGTWIIETYLGPRPMEGTFKVTGTELTGTIKLGGGTVVPISSGKVQGKAISFAFEGEQKTPLVLKGQLNGEVIDFILSIPPNEDGVVYTARKK
jgi:hypothetical protein